MTKLDTEGVFERPHPPTKPPPKLPPRPPLCNPASLVKDVDSETLKAAYRVISPMCAKYEDHNQIFAHLQKCCDELAKAVRIMEMKK